jgi:excisionase family DNA binding protein
MSKKNKLTVTGAAKPTARAMMPTAGELLTDLQAAEYFSVEPRTIRLWRTKGLPFIRLTRKVVRFRKADLDEFAARRRVAIVN